MTTGTHDASDEVRRQLDRLEIVSGRPLLISDADEVLFAFMLGFEAYMERQGAYFDWSSYRLNGNIRSKHDDAPLEPQDVRRLLTGFFHDETRNIAPVEGAAHALEALGRRMQIVVLSNVPHAQHEDRRHALARHGMDYPLVANEGSKAPAVRLLAERAGGPVVFIDDSPGHHREVAELAPGVRRIHFIGNRRLAALLGQAEHSHYRASSWDDMRRHIEHYLSSEGH